MAVSTDDIGKVSLNDILATLKGSSDDDQVCEAAHWLRESRDERAIEPTIHRLAGWSDPPWVRKELVVALGSVLLSSGSDHPGARDLLIEILSSPSESEETREASALALGHLREIRAVDLLLDILQSGNTGLTFACATALGNVGDSRAIGPLIQLLGVDRLLIPQTAAKGLGKYGRLAKNALPALDELARRGNDAERRFALEAIERITQDLQDK
jgi:HEAT repeat protein